jgi:hypothetical protein
MGDGRNVGIVLRHVRIDRGYQYASDEARERAARFGIVDDRVEVVDHWSEARSWFAAPVLVAGEVLGSSGGYELLVGYTRLGNLLGMLDREEVLEANTHLVWWGDYCRDRRRVNSAMPTSRS